MQENNWSRWCRLVIISSISCVAALILVWKTIKGEEDTLKQMIDRNAGIEMDVERFKERKRIEHAVIKNVVRKHTTLLIFNIPDQAFGSSHACCSVSRSPRKVFGSQGEAKKTSRKSQKVEEQECSCTCPSQVSIYLCCSHSSSQIGVSDYIFSGRWKETIQRLRGKETN